MMKLRTTMEKSMVGIQSRIKLARIDLKSLFASESLEGACEHSPLLPQICVMPLSGPFS